jgi:chemotaxis protein MotB
LAEREPMIVVKKITYAADGGHGGSWKVAFADFMTAMMAFFLLMWLLAQSDEVKQDVADHFSTPSVIEYNFSNYGVELTLEKLFLDLMNEPLKFFQAFMTPADLTPNIMAMGSKNIVRHEIADKLGDIAQDVQVYGNEIKFNIPAERLFQPGTGDPSSEFITIMESVKGLTTGLEDSNIYVDSIAHFLTLPGGSKSAAKGVAEKRLDLITRKVEVGLEHDTVDIFGRAEVERYTGKIQGQRPQGMIKFLVKAKNDIPTERKPRKFEDLFGERDKSMNVYDGFVKQLSNKKKPEKE